jgi:hypothetical protein
MGFHLWKEIFAYYLCLICDFVDYNEDKIVYCYYTVFDSQTID